MIHRIKSEGKEQIITLASNLVYGQRKQWCESVYAPLKMSIIKPRQFFYYDEKKVLPAIVWFCGGGFTEMDRNVWIPELSWYAKRGYVVASVEYSVTARTKFPMQIEDAKLAIRYLRAHAKEIGIRPDKIIAAGESAGGYLSALVGLTGNRREFDVGDYKEQSSSVQGVVSFYPVTTPSAVMPNPELVPAAADRKNMPDLPPLVEDSTPPYMLLCGTKDSQVPYTQSQILYDALQEKKIRSELYIVEGAEHADAPFFQSSMKERILEFMNSI